MPKASKRADIAAAIRSPAADECIRSVYEKLQVRSRVSTIAIAVKEGLV